MDTEYIGSLSMYVTEVTTTKRTFRVIGKSSAIAEYFRDTELEVRCAYCGHVYEEGTPESRKAELSKHIEVCEEHPIQPLKNRIAELEEELAKRSST
jgi:exosome complex RNA-binding protein Rrp4